MAKWDKTFWKATAERVVGTAGAVAITVLGANQFGDIDWATGGWFIVSASAVTLLKSIVANTATNDGPGFGQAEVLNERNQNDH